VPKRVVEALAPQWGRAPSHFSGRASSGTHQSQRQADLKDLNAKLGFTEKIGHDTHTYEWA
jgi:hypothetical protein